MSQAIVEVQFTLTGDIGDIVQSVEDLKQVLADHFDYADTGTLLSELQVATRNIP